MLPSELTITWPSFSGAQIQARVAYKTLSLELQFIRCSKPTCCRCVKAPAHGPYWYAAKKIRRGKRLVRRLIYLGFNPRPDHPNLAKHPDLQLLCECAQIAAASRPSLARLLARGAQPYLAKPQGEAAHPDRQQSAPTGADRRRPPPPIATHQKYRSPPPRTVDPCPSSNNPVRGRRQRVREIQSDLPGTENVGLFQ